MFNPMNWFRGKISQAQARQKAERDQWVIRCPTCDMAVGPQGTLKLNDEWKCRYCGNGARK